MGEEKMKKAYFSRRLYKSEMDILPVTETSYALELFNQAKRFAFQTLIREKRWDENYIKKVCISL
jgi:hypothetical protein